MGLIYVAGFCRREHTTLEALRIFAVGGVCTRMAVCPCGAQGGECPHPPVE